MPDFHCTHFDSNTIISRLLAFWNPKKDFSTIETARKPHLIINHKIKSKFRFRRRNITSLTMIVGWRIPNRYDVIVRPMVTHDLLFRLSSTTLAEHDLFITSARTPHRNRLLSQVRGDKMTNVHLLNALDIPRSLICDRVRCIVHTERAKSYFVWWNKYNLPIDGRWTRLKSKQPFKSIVSDLARTTGCFCFVCRISKTVKYLVDVVLTAHADSLQYLLSANVSARIPLRSHSIIFQLMSNAIRPNRFQN